MGLSAWGVYSVDVAIRLIMSSGWHSIIPLRSGSSNSIIPLQYIYVKYGDCLDIVTYISRYVGTFNSITYSDAGRWLIQT